MCGIVGIFQVGLGERRRFNGDVVRAMTDMMIHRGPDDSGIAIGNGYALAARRLSIVDIAGGHQPVANETGTVIAVQNGEIYNHVSLRSALQSCGHTIRSRCDTEVLPHLYEEHGSALPEHLDGEFAVAVWDIDQRRGVIARDRAGVKPLYYAIVDDVVVVASELKSVMASGIVKRDLDHGAIDAYLTLGFVPGPFTLFREVRKLLPAHRLVIGDETIRCEEYWQYPQPLSVSPARPEEDLAEELLAEIERAVARRLMGDTPIGAMLSGGLDSSLVVALMARRSKGAVKTFSVGFTGARDNELPAARAVAHELSTDHTELELSPDDEIDLLELAWLLDEPVADLSSLGFRALSALAARDVTVALSGQGADELLAGYGRYHRVRQLERAARLPLPFRRAAALATRRAPLRIREATRLAVEDDRVAAAITLRSPWACRLREQSARWLTADRGLILDEVIGARLDGQAGGDLDRALTLDARLSLVDDMLHYFDRMSMAYSLEVRVPFLDHHVVEFCASVPADLKLKGVNGKYLLRRVARELVPTDVLNRPKIGFFSSTVDQWFASQVQRELGEVLRNPSARYAEFLDSRIAVEPLVASASRRYAESKFLLSVLMLEVWLQVFAGPSEGPRVTDQA